MYVYPEIERQDHIIHVYKSKGNKLEVSSRFIFDGIRSGTPVHIFFDSKTIEMIRSLIDFLENQKKDLVHFYEAEQILVDRSFTVERFFDDMKNAVPGGSSGTSTSRFLIDMNFFSSSSRQMGNLLSIEEKINGILKNTDSIIMCEYFYEFIPNSGFGKLVNLHNKMILDPLLKIDAGAGSRRRINGGGIENILDRFIFARSARELKKAVRQKENLARIFPRVEDYNDRMNIIVDTDFSVQAYQTPPAFEVKMKRIEERKLGLFDFFDFSDSAFTPEVLKKSSGKQQFIATLNEGPDSNSKGLLNIWPIVSAEKHIGYFITFDIIEGGSRRNALVSPPEEAGEKRRYPYFFVETNGEKLLITEKEFQIIQYVMAGKQNKEIAHELNLAEITIKKYLSSIYRKLGIKNRYDLIHLIQRNIS